MWYNLDGDTMHINSIKKQKNGFYKIVGEKTISLADEVIINYNILYKKELDDDLIAQLIEENYKYDILHKTIKYVSTKMRSKKEINKYLAKYELNENDKKFILNKLTNLNLINDNSYAAAYVYDRFNLYHDGPNKIKKDLLANRISEDIIDDELAKITNEDIYVKLSKMIIKKISHNTKYAKGEFKRKIEQEFVGLGYDLAMIDEIFDDNFISLNEAELIEKEYYKIYHKYVNKYDPKKLITVIKQKLYQKGFNVDDINNVVNKNL